jgi:hypothetical protein
LIIVGLFAFACSGGGDDKGKATSNTDSGPEPQALAARDALIVSSEKQEEIESYRGTFEMSFGSGGLSFGMSGDYVYEAPDKMYMTMEMFGEEIEMLVILPDMYMKLPGEGWVVFSLDDAGADLGIDFQGLLDYAEQRGPVDYSSIVDGLEDVVLIGDETIDGVAYEHYRGTLDFASLMEDVPADILDPELFDMASDVVSGLTVEVWLEAETQLPYRTVMSMDMGGLPDVDETITMTITTTSVDYNEPVDIPDAPTDARPISDLAGF